MKDVKQNDFLRSRKKMRPKKNSIVQIMDLSCGDGIDKKRLMKSKHTEGSSELNGKLECVDCASLSSSSSSARIGSSGPGALTERAVRGGKSSFFRDAVLGGRSKQVKSRKRRIRRLGKEQSLSHEQKHKHADERAKEKLTQSPIRKQLNVKRKENSSSSLSQHSKGKCNLKSTSSGSGSPWKTICPRANKAATSSAKYKLKRCRRKEPSWIAWSSSLSSALRDFARR